MRSRALLIVFLAFTQQLLAQFAVSADRHYLLKDGKPFFWMGDTAWELFHRLNREEADHYLKRRSEQGFTVIQGVVLAEMDGLHTPNAYGQTPLINDDPLRPNEKYFEHVDYIIDRAAHYGLSIALLPTWGDKLNTGGWGMGPEIFNEENAAAYAGWLAKRYMGRKNILWLLGGDRTPRGEQDVAVWRSMGRSIMNATGKKAVISFHPQPNQKGSAEWFHNDEWLAFNMFQNGHCRDVAIYDKIRAAYDLQPTKPVIDGEPIYEDHPVCFDVKDLGTSSPYDVRKYAYLDLFAGAFGHTYGCHDIWQMNSPNTVPVNGPHFNWMDALELPGANQMRYVRALMESHPLTERVPDQSVLLDSALSPPERVQATRGRDFLMVYTAAGKQFTILSTKINASKPVAYWFDPRTGKTEDVPLVSGGNNQPFLPPSTGYGKDWVLVIEDGNKGFKRP